LPPAVLCCLFWRFRKREGAVRKQVTLRDIAAATGVHVSTVSRALDPVTATSLSEELVQRIRATAAGMGYRRNHIASSLRTQRSMTVGVVIPDISNWIFPPMVRGIEGVLEEAGYAAFIVNTDNIPAREERHLAVLRERGVDGILHAAVLRDSPAISVLVEEGVPVITLNRRVEPATIPFVVNDEDAGIRMMVGHLVDEGHTQIAAISGPQSLSTGMIRQRALLATLSGMGLRQPACSHVEADEFTEAEGRRCCADLFDRGNHFTAVLCANDRLALGALTEIQARGLSCPDDISLTGFNDMPFLDRIPPGLTTVRIEQAQAGAVAAGLLVRMMRGEDIPTETVLPVQMIRRGSVIPPLRLRKDPAAAR
jgi:LacI family transcriptional regulator